MKLCGRQPPQPEEKTMTGETTNTEQGRAAADCPNERVVMPTCETCKHWKFGHEFNHGDADLPYCTEMRFWVNMMGTTYPHTPADFGCNKHSDFEA